jgi:integrase
MLLQFKRYTAASFVSQRVTVPPGDTDHTFAALLYFARVDILTAKDQLGHTDIKMTQFELGEALSYSDKGNY